MNPSNASFTLPPGIRISAASNHAYGSHMGSYQPFPQPQYDTKPALPPQPCPFSPDDVAALKAVAAPLRQAIGAPHEPISNLSDLATLILRLEHVAKKIEAIITLHTP